MTKELKVVSIFCAIVLVQLGWHFFLTYHTHVSQTLLRLYLLHNEHSRKGVAGYVDLVLPAIVTGLLLGHIGWRWSLSKRAAFVLAFGAVLVALTFAYAKIISEEQAWWWPKDQRGLNMFILGQTAIVLLILSVCTYGGRIRRIEQ